MNTNLKDGTNKPKTIEMAAFRLPANFKRVKGTNYFAFNVTDDHMTDSTQKSIPEGSMALGKELKLKGNAEQIVPFNTYFASIPINKPIVLIGKKLSGEDFAVIRTVCMIDHRRYLYLLHSYNSSHKDGWISVERIHRVFEVVAVKLPNGKTFVPKTVSSPFLIPRKKIRAVAKGSKT